MSTEETKKNELWTWKESPNGAVALTGEIDFTVSPMLRDRMMALIDATRGEVVMDLSGLDYIDSSGLAVFIETRKVLLAKGRAIRIDGVSEQVAKLFNLTQIGELFGL